MLQRGAVLLTRAPGPPGYVRRCGRGPSGTLLAMLRLLAATATALMMQTGSASHMVLCNTTAGSFTISLVERWSSRGVRRFSEALDAGFFDDQIIYLVILPHFLIQFGAPPAMVGSTADMLLHVTINWEHNPGVNMTDRKCFVFISWGSSGDALGPMPQEIPVGQVMSGHRTIDNILKSYELSGYGNLAWLQREIAAKGNSAADAYPKLERVLSCVALPDQAISSATSMSSMSATAMGSMSSMR